MGFKCPHCGESLDVIKHEDVTSAKPIDDTSDFADGIVKATANAIEQKVRKEEAVAMSGLQQLNAMANGSLSRSDVSLAGGWGGSMLKALEERDHKDNHNHVNEGLDPDMMDREVAANKIQNLIGAALSKSEE